MKALTLTCALAILGAAPQTSHAAPLQTPTMQSDSTMRTAIEGRIDRDDSLKDYDVDVTVKDGVATLSGSVRTEAQKAHAAELAKAAGATSVNNMIAVKATASPRGTSGTVESKTRDTVDAAKSGAAKAADETGDAAEKAGDKTEDAADKAWEKTKDGWEVVVDKTAAAAKAVGAEVTDAWITTSITTKFAGEDALENSHIDVDTDNHVVTLKGAVATEAGRARAIEIVKDTDGVDRIVDRLTVAAR